MGDGSFVDAIGASNPGGYIAGGGCDCSTPGAPLPLSLLGWLVAAALARARRRR
jgi:MYXO-CTERM domain-containing protein